jgi:hypothetical protein
MLCPNCGKDIEDQTSICEECSKIESQDLEEEPRLHPSIEEAKKPNKALFIALGVGAFLLGIVGITVVLFSGEQSSLNKVEVESKNENLTVDTTTQKESVAGKTELATSSVVAESAKNETEDLPPPPTPGAPEAVSPEDATPKVEVKSIELPSVPVLASGYVKLGDQKIAIVDAIAAYYPVYNKLEIAFYREKLPQDLRKTLASLPSLKSDAVVSPDFIAEVFLRKGTTVCSNASISQYRASAYLLKGGVRQDLIFDFQNSSGGITEFNCLIDNGGQLNLTLAQATTKVLETGEKIDVKWEAKAIGAMWYLPSSGEFEYSALNTTPMFLWRPSSHELEVGYFLEKLVEEDYSKARSQKSLYSINGKSPQVSLIFAIDPVATTFDLKNLQSYKIVFNRNDEVGPRFPGEKNKVVLAFEDPERTWTNLAQFSGELSEGSSLHFAMNNWVDHRIGDTNYLFKWFLNTTGKIIDVEADSKSSFAVEGLTESLAPTKSQGQIAVGNAKAEFKSAVAQYFKSEGEVLVAFYQEELTVAERAEIKKRKSVWSQINEKLPNLVVFMKLKPGANEFLRENILNYRLVFVREKLGQFYFPGPSERLVVKQLGEELTATNSGYLAGKIQDGEKISFLLKGEQASQGKLETTWDLQVLEDLFVY